MSDSRDPHVPRANFTRGLILAVAALLICLAWPRGRIEAPASTETTRPAFRHDPGERQFVTNPDAQEHERPRSWLDGLFLQGLELDSQLPEIRTIYDTPDKVGSGAFDSDH